MTQWAHLSPLWVRQQSTKRKLDQVSLHQMMTMANSIEEYKENSLCHGQDDTNARVRNTRKLCLQLAMVAAITASVIATLTWKNNENDFAPARRRLEMTIQKISDSGSVVKVPERTSVKKVASVRPSIVKSIDVSASPDLPGIVQLMGFPFSGQGFLQRSVHDLTKSSTAINYGEAVMLTTGVIINDALVSVPVYSDSPNGPFAFSHVHPFPTSGHILTRTYCGGHCSGCWPQDYVVPSKRVFQYECNTGARLRQDGEVVPTYYDSERVKKYVHLMRNPLTHIVARFDHEFTRWKIHNHKPTMEKYPHSRYGFLKWCSETDDNVHEGRRFEIEKFYYLKDDKIEALARQVPCHSHFFRMVQWHNYAFDVMDEEKKLHDKPVKIIYYENIESDPENVVNNLLEYLELEKISGAVPPPFNEIKHGATYFKKSHIAIIRAYVKALSSERTWPFMSRYFDVYTK